MAYPESNAPAWLLDSLAALADVDLPEASRTGVCEHLATADRVDAEVAADRDPGRQQDQTLADRRAAITWAQRLSRVFNIDVSVCPKYEGEARVTACIEDPGVLENILEHLKQKVGPESLSRL